MKSMKIANIGEIRNELNKYKKGKKLDIHQFNQVARLAWLGKIVMQPLDLEDPDCKSFLVYIQEPEELAAHFLDTDQELTGGIHIIDGEQAMAMVEIMRSGVEERAKLYEDLSRSDFYFRYFYQPGEEDKADDPGAGQGKTEG
ncbi:MULTISPECIES: hypothetical protein [unclassified Thioalkalivibrio]|uniref:hypothetical protein n=1 Tax=unclassified Thioalkalivibrio TaxID=2621013 RepID=UPI00037B13DA|nr:MULTISPECIES: hypothetical protein [unclassified Thioalkalivibrio]